MPKREKRHLGISPAVKRRTTNLPRFIRPGTKTTYNSSKCEYGLSSVIL